ncbi:MAG: FadR/GntR family transcriptional regulator [Solirubrobacteraceae bacterium]|jgi:DNA-binding FadR family transcriptional regulator
MTVSLDALINGQPQPRPARLGTAVLSTIIDNIVNGSLPPDSTLPTERELCAAFGVSRSVIRESVKVLEEKGLVRVRQGQGTTVAAAEQWNLLDPLVLEASIRYDETLKTLDALVDVRVGLESQMTRRAAVAMSDTQIGELHSALLALALLLDKTEAYALADTEYHDLILRGSGNQLGRSIIRAIHPFARASMRYTGTTTAEDLASSHRGHIKIYERLAERDADGAAAAMREHILGSWLERRARHSA